MKGQKLTKVDDRLRLRMRLTTDSNRRAALNYHRELQRKQGRNVCTWCGAEPCGHLWTRPGDRESAGGERCCDRCSHMPVEGWQHTHTAWNGAASYPVCAIRMQAGDVVYMRRDGVIMFLEMQKPAPPDSPTPMVPTVAFLGDDGGTALYTAGEGAAEHTNLWEKRAELDVVWLPVRMSAALAADEERKRLLAERLSEEAAEWERQENLRREAEAAKLDKTIVKRQLEHETRIVMDEMVERGELADEPEDAEETVDLDDVIDEEAEGEEKPEIAAAAKEPERKLTLAELKKPRPVKKGPGRPKRSKRQRIARKRQKMAWARQEAAQRLEVKRLERAARNQGEIKVKDEEDGST